MGRKVKVLSEIKIKGKRQIITQNEYDKEGNVKKTTVSDNSTIEFNYDNLGRVIKSEKSNNGITVTSAETYNWEGDVLTETDAKGKASSVILPSQRG